MDNGNWLNLLFSLKPFSVTQFIFTKICFHPGYKKMIALTSIISINRQTPNIWRALIGNIIVDNSGVVGASPVGAAPTTSELST